MGRRKRQYAVVNSNILVGVAGILVLVFAVSYVVFMVIVRLEHRHFKDGSNKADAYYFYDDRRYNGHQRKQVSADKVSAQTPEATITIQNIMGNPTAIRVPIKLSGRRKYKPLKGTVLRTFERVAPLSKTPMLFPGSEEEIMLRKTLALQYWRVVDSHDHPYLIEPTDICRQQESPQMVVAVQISPHLHDIRHYFRQHVWGGYGQTINDAGDQKALLVFFLGLPGDMKQQRLIENEAKQFNDIVMASYEDTSTNSSLKAVSALRWLVSRCPHAKFVVTATETCLVNVPLMLTELRLKRERLPLFLLGRAHRQRLQQTAQKSIGDTIRPQKPASSNPASPEALKGSSSSRSPPRRDRAATARQQEKVDYLERGCVGFPTSVARLLYEAALRVPQLRHDHVFVTGVCASFVNVPRYDNRAFYFAPPHYLTKSLREPATGKG